MTIQPTITPAQTITPSLTPTDLNREPDGSAATANWKTYKNEFGYYFSYPQNWNIDSLNPATVTISGDAARITFEVFSKKQNELYPRGPEIKLPCNGIESTYEKKSITVSNYPTEYVFGNLGCWWQNDKIIIRIHLKDDQLNPQENERINITYEEFDGINKRWLFYQEWKEKAIFDQILSTFRFLQ